MRPETPPISDGVPEHVPTPDDTERDETSDGVPEHIGPPDEKEVTSDGVPEHIPDKRTPNP